ncbi:MAG TPA: glutamate synthase-related protein [bacterium]|nr:glutamate synthase-related protein [bacterium]HOL48212.1 glutamate synthase-related protein [bacterium]HPQ19197.1 glutamate synthase-related protein [bacterium]
MAKRIIPPDFKIERDLEKCILCQACKRMCANDAHIYDEDFNIIFADNSKCVGCHFCENICPTGALTIKRNESEYKENANWNTQRIKSVIKQANTGGIILTGMGCDRDYKIYWDHILLNAAQVTNPSIDPLREPMELRTYIGRKPNKFDIKKKLTPQLKLETPILFSAMSYGSISFNASLALASAAAEFGIFYNSGEGGLHKDLYKYSENTIVQVASGRFGVYQEYLEKGAAIEIKIGQGAKPGIGGHLPGEKVTKEISETRMIPEGTDAISPAPHHDIYSIEDLQQLIYAIKEATRYKKPIGVKVAAVHNIAPIAAGIVRAGADYVAIDGIRGGTGAAPLVIRDNVGIPIELAIAVVDQRLREEGIRNNASIIAAGGFRNSADILKAIALGADAVYIGTAALIALGCSLCQKCYTGKCNWGIATQDPYLTKRLNPEIGKRNLVNLLRAWSLEIKEMLGGMGINAIESLRGNREQLRGINLTNEEAKILGIKLAGEAW